MRTEPEGGFTVMVPSLPGCVTYGKTLEKAQVMARDAIEAYLVSLRKHKEEVPEEESVFLTSVKVTDFSSSFAHA